MDRPGVQQVPEGSGEQGKMEKSGCKIICGAPTTLAVKGLMMMIMMMGTLTVFEQSLNFGKMNHMCKTKLGKTERMITQISSVTFFAGFMHIFSSFLSPFKGKCA